MQQGPLSSTFTKSPPICSDPPNLTHLFPTQSPAKGTGSTERTMHRTTSRRPRRTSPAGHGSPNRRSRIRDANVATFAQKDEPRCRRNGRGHAGQRRRSHPCCCPRGLDGDQTANRVDKWQQLFQRNQQLCQSPGTPSTPSTPSKARYAASTRRQRELHPRGFGRGAGDQDRLRGREGQDRGAIRRAGPALDVGSMERSASSRSLRPSPTG